MIHTRISETLEQELKERASRLGVSVSNLVRNVLLNTFGLVEDVGAALTSSPPDRGIIGWQRLVLNIDTECARCNAPLARSSDAVMGVAASSSAPRSIVCLLCFEELRKPAADRTEHLQT